MFWFFWCLCRLVLTSIFSSFTQQATGITFEVLDDDYKVDFGKITERIV